jgi:hypothetical protein
MSDICHEQGDINDELYKHVRWLLSEANKLSEARDDAIHSPLVSSGVRKPNVESGAFHGHPRAAQLAKKDLLSEFRWCRDAAITLTDFSYNLAGFMMGDQPTLPDIPLLPNRGQKNTPQGQLRQPRPKPRARPPRSSGA